MRHRLRAASFALALLALAPMAAFARGGDDAPPAAPRIDPEPIRANITALAADEFNGRSFRSEEGKAAARWIGDKLAAAGATPLPGRDSMLVPVARMPAAAPNVVAWHAPKGAKPSGEYILVTAHFDHLPPARSGDDRIFNGADDNASGVSGMIAVAEALRGATLDVGVVFVGFTGEEAGLVGSRAFLEEETLPPARIRGMFNMDMISRQPDGAIRLDGGPKGKLLVDLLVRLAPRVPLEMKVDTHPDWLARSDQGPFLSAGIPAVLFSCEDHEDYHQVTDHADKADPVLAAKVASLVALAVQTFATEMPPRFDLSPCVGADGSQLRPIRVGRTMPNAPYWTAATRRNPDRGSDAALLAALAKETGWNFEERPVTIAEQVESLVSGEVDILLNGASAELRALGPAGAVAALEPGYRADSGPALLVKADSTISATSDLSTMRIAARPGSAAAAYLARTRPTLAVESTNEPEGTLAGKVSSGALDGLAGDALALEVRASRDPAFRVVRLDAQASVVLVRAADPALGERLSAAIRAAAAAQTPREPQAETPAAPATSPSRP